MSTTEAAVAFPRIKQRLAEKDVEAKKKNLIHNSKIKQTKKQQQAMEKSLTKEAKDLYNEKRGPVTIKGGV